MAGASPSLSRTERRIRLMNRFHAWRAARGDAATAFVSQPEPRAIGSFARGRQLVGGNFLFSGYLLEAPDTGIWDLPFPTPSYEEALHGFSWMDDLAAVGDKPARVCAQEWTFDWVDRFGKGQGLGWTPDLTGRRLIRWINHAIFVLRGCTPEQSNAFFASLGQQTEFLGRRWHVATPGLARFEALVGLLYAGLTLSGKERFVAPAVAALDKECDQQIDDQGGIATRNPEDLLQVFTLFSWALVALNAVDQTPSRTLKEAMNRIAPTLRALRHADGGLARFHGGGRGLEGRLDLALAEVGVRSRPDPAERHMGFGRLSSARTTIVVDAAIPPAGPASANAHASTLAFELTSGRRPLIVSCGTGANFGEDWRRAGRATPSHSTLGIDGVSSSRLGPIADGSLPGEEILVSAPNEVSFQHKSNRVGGHFTMSHNGYQPSHGLTHFRTLELSQDGRSVQGEDTLAAMAETDKATFENVMTRVQLQGVVFAIRFHLHPDVDAALDLGGTAVSLELKSGEMWVFRHDGVAELSLEPSVYLEKARLKPRATKQIVLTSRVLDFARQIGWTLAKAQDTPRAIRDVVTDDLPEFD
jgi:uncharacterized heparinase superfamily protein